MNQLRSRFEAKVIHRRKVAAAFSAGYFILMMAAEAVMDVLVFYVAMPDLDHRVRMVVVGILAFFTVLAYMAGWNSQRNFKGTIDTWLADADPVEKLVVANEVAEERKAWEQEARVLDVTGDQGAQG